MKNHLIWVLAALGSIAASQDATAREPTKPVPSNNPGAWVLGEDYPIKELRAEVTGTTTFKLAIDSSGKVSGCEIVESSGSATLDATTCKLVTQRAQFTPARSAKGVSVPGEYTNRVRWTIPEDQPMLLPDQKWQVVTTVDVNKEGAVESCEYAIDGGYHAEVALPEAPCATFPIGSKSQKITDSAGNPLAVRMTVIQSIEITPR